MALYLLSLIIGFQQSCQKLSKPDLQCMYPSDLCLVASYSRLHPSSSPFYSYLHLHRLGTIHQRCMAWWIIGSADFQQLGLFDLFDTMNNNHNKEHTSIFPSKHLLSTLTSHLLIYLHIHQLVKLTILTRHNCNNVCRRCCCRSA